MKHIRSHLFAIIAIIITLGVGIVAGYAFARMKYKPLLLSKDTQIASVEQSVKKLEARESNMIEKPKMQDGIIMQGGHMMQVKDNSMSSLTKSMTMQDGTKITTAGRVTMKDGSVMQMREGEELTMNGKVIDATILP